MDKVLNAIKFGLNEATGPLAKQGAGLQSAFNYYNQPPQDIGMLGRLGQARQAYSQGEKGFARGVRSFEEDNPNLATGIQLASLAAGGAGLAKLGYHGVKAASPFLRDFAKGVSKRGRDISKVRPLEAGKLSLGQAVDELPMDETSRIARAREMGYDVDNPVYHGTPDSFERFDTSKSPAFFADNPKAAEYYTGDIRDERGNPNIIKAFLNVKNTFDSKDAKKMAVLKNEFLKSGKPHEFENHLPRLREQHYDVFRDPQVKKALHNAGFDSYKTAEQGGHAIAVFNPANIRSQFAKFDPRQVSSANLLASLIPGIGTAGLMMNQSNGRNGQI